MRYINKREIIKLIENVNKSKKRAEKGLYPLEPIDDGWRIILPPTLDKYDFLPSAKKLLELAIFDSDFQGNYYWIPYFEPPNGVTTPAIRLAKLQEK